MTHYELTIRDYFRIIRKRKLLIIFSFFVFSALAFFYVSSQTPVFKANSTVKIEERKTVAGLLTEWIVYNQGDVLETQSKVILGFDVMKQVALRMGFCSLDASLAQINEVVADLQGEISTEKVGNTNIISIIAVSSNPERAMNLANNTAQAYIEYNLAEKNKQARSTRKFIEEQLASIESRLYAAENKLKSYGEDVNTVNLSADVEKQITDLESQLVSLLQKYTEKHPKVIQLKEQISRLETQTGNFSSKDLDYVRLKREIEVNRKLYSMLREKLEEIRITEAEKVSDISIVDPAQMPRVPVNTTSQISIILGGILGLVIGMILSFIVETMDTSMGTIEDVENLTKLLVLGVIPSVVYGQNKALTWTDRWRRRLFPKQISEKEKRYVRLIAYNNPTSPVAEAFRNLKTNIKFSTSRKVVLVTSAGPQEGKTTTLINLGLVCAQDGLRTVMISSDLRRPAIVESFGLDKKPGLSEVIMGSSSLEQALRNVADLMLGDIPIDDILKRPGLERIWMLASGALPVNPAEILGSPEMDNLIAVLRREFDVVIFDSPPVLPVTDAAILAAKVDAAILCYEIGRTSRHALLRAKSQLETTAKNILGIVLNHIEPETESVEVYPYYYKYKYYDANPEEEKEKPK